MTKAPQNTARQTAAPRHPVRGGSAAPGVRPGPCSSPAPRSAAAAGAATGPDPQLLRDLEAARAARHALEAAAARALEDPDRHSLAQGQAGGPGTSERGR